MVSEFFLPDTGSNTPIEIIEVQVKPGDAVEKGQTLLTLESDKATIDVPATESGKIVEVFIKVGQKIKTGDLICTFESSNQTDIKKTPLLLDTKETSPREEKIEYITSTNVASDAQVLAGPSTRRLARLLGVNLIQVKGTGKNARITKDDVKAYVKNILTTKQISSVGFSLPSMPSIDFAEFGPIETIPLTRLKRLTAQNLSRNWLLAPHVTQFDEADITKLEAFRKKETPLFEKQGIKLTPLVFIMKAVVEGLKVFPQLNASLDTTNENLILKKYYHLGIAVDTSEGLVVPVVRNVDQKSFVELAQELAKISTKARERKLNPQDLQGSTFTISSLGGIGGTAFTPIINLPNVAILGVSKSITRAFYDGQAFQPRLMLPLSLSYDHRVIDGAEGARFIVMISAFLSDPSKLT